MELLSLLSHTHFASVLDRGPSKLKPVSFCCGGVAGVVGIEGGVVSGVINLESSSVGASDWRPRHEELYQEV
jgi:hypothetical protein